MLSLANTVSSSGVAHEQLYSLLLDGTSDWLDIGDNWDPGTTDFSVSLWFKANSDSGETDILFSKRVDSNNRIEIGIKPDNKLFTVVSADSNSVINNTAATEIDALGLNWINVVLTVDRNGSAKLYVNASTSTYGLDVTAGNSGQDLNNSANLYIGAYSDGSLEFQGKIDEVAIWNVALDSDAVTALYNSGKPFDLNNDTGNYDNSSALYSYWRMGNGPFDDKRNGAVHDAHNPGVGADVIDNGGFDDGSDWSITNNTGTASEITGGYLRIKTPDTTYTAVSQASKTVANGVYKLDYTVLESDGGDLGLITQGNVTSSIPSSVGTHIYYYISHSTSFILKRRANTLDVKIDNVQLRRLNGYPGLTSGSGLFSADTPDD